MFIGGGLRYLFVGRGLHGLFVERLMLCVLGEIIVDFFVETIAACLETNIACLLKETNVAVYWENVMILFRKERKSLM